MRDYETIQRPSHKGYIHSLCPPCAESQDEHLSVWEHSHQHQNYKIFRVPYPVAYQLLTETHKITSKVHQIRFKKQQRTSRNMQTAHRDIMVKDALF